MPRSKKFDEDIVLRKAVEIFWRQGFHATSIQDLVEGLGINRASLYNTFTDKETLFERSIAQYRAENGARFQNLLNSYDSVKEGLAALFEKSIQQGSQDCDSKGCFVVNTTTEMIPGDEKILEVVSQNKTQFEQLFKAYLASGVAKGEIAPDKDLDTLAQFLFTFHNGLQVVAKINPDPQALSKLVKSALSILD